MEKGFIIKCGNCGEEQLFSLEEYKKSINALIMPRIAFEPMGYDSYMMRCRECGNIYEMMEV